VLLEFDNQMRRTPVPDPGSRVERERRVTRIVSREDGWNGVLWTDLADADVDAMIAAQVGRFAESGRPWEWKYYSYDQPAELPRRLQAAGFVPDPVETLLVAEIADLDLNVSPPAGVELVPVTDAHGATMVVRVHDEVFGGDHAAIGSVIVTALESRPRPVEAVVAVAGDAAISAGRVEFPAGSDFAGLWGGGTLPGWRGRGVFRSLVAYRARLARERSYRYLQVDASADSRPILQRLGFAELAKTIAFRHPGTVPARRGGAASTGHIVGGAKSGDVLAELGAGAGQDRDRVVQALHEQLVLMAAEVGVLIAERPASRCRSSERAWRRRKRGQDGSPGR
jgi:GNAT superfamily N-acetyltransferase